MNGRVGAPFEREQAGGDFLGDFAVVHGWENGCGDGSPFFSSGSVGSRKAM
jgi:hypothetical protein